MKRVVTIIPVLAIMVVSLPSARGGDSNAAGVALVQGTESKAIEVPFETATNAQTQRWNFHVQNTE
jgi:hypothetical protein